MYKELLERLFSLACIICGMIVFVVILSIPNSFALCPDHGIKSGFTGNTRTTGKTEYCEYQHPLDTGGVHKFWEKCN